MAIRGAKPKDNRDAVRHRNKLVHDWTEVEELEFDEPRKLPARRLGGKSWPALTRRWWKAVSTMPHCSLWTDSDWSYAIDTALIAAEFHDGDVRAAGELRAREKVLGTTHDARRDLRIRYVTPKGEATEGAPAGVANLDEYRNLYD